MAAPGVIRERPNVIGALGGLLWLLVTIVPVYYLVLTSLRRQQAYYAENPLLPPAAPTLGAYRLVLENDFLRYLTNSVIVTVVAVALVLATSLMASYYLVRSGSRLSRGVLSVVLLGLAIPVQATIVPVYYLIVRLGLYDSLFALILPAVAFAIPISVLIIVNFVRDIPAELFESMHADGAGHWRILHSLVLPLSRPALVTVGVYEALQVWNGFLFPLILTQSSSVRVLPLSLWTYQGQFAVNVPAVLAAVTLSALPVLAAYIVGRRQIVSGLTAGFGK
ncbi:carbohydrate ABC transporter permease [Jiangella asiatica]|uniref:Carbohydrate ABC transporter permease n=1 Tax=Jiangella asiatica TaxID=2530372 RepID=A0A4R5CTA5_9ACTN|nr:carbohydrate ABC transporter permease [Jiangella asiatica]TDE01035.1 carbohydrate ABC transporter permease [Jiangella asiatica]